MMGVTKALREINLSSFQCYYRPQRKFAKVMFLQVCVCPQGVCGRGMCKDGGLHGRGGGHAMQGGVHGGGYAWWGACMVGGMHATHTPRTLRDTVDQCAGGTHPTGMHSCLH